MHCFHLQVVWTRQLMNIPVQCVSFMELLLTMWSNSQALPIKIFVKEQGILCLSYCLHRCKTTDKRYVNVKCQNSIKVGIQNFLVKGQRVWNKLKFNTGTPLIHKWKWETHENWGVTRFHNFLSLFFPNSSCLKVEE
jgi:hypothetical protein